MNRLTVEKLRDELWVDEQKNSGRYWIWFVNIMLDLIFSIVKWGLIWLVIITILEMMTIHIVTDSEVKKLICS